MQEEQPTYFEDLDVGIICPHEDAFAPDGETVLYRYIPKGDVSSECFLPTVPREDRPLPRGFDDCIAKSVSIFNDLEGMLNALFRLPHNKGKKKKVCVLQLKPKDGVLKQTFDNPNHHSWWCSQQFDYTIVQTQEIVIE